MALAIHSLAKTARWSTAVASATVIMTPLGASMVSKLGAAGMLDAGSGFVRAAEEITQHVSPLWSIAGVALVGMAAVAKAVQVSRARHLSP